MCGNGPTLRQTPEEQISSESNFTYLLGPQLVYKKCVLEGYVPALNNVTHTKAEDCKCNKGGGGEIPHPRFCI